MGCLALVFLDGVADVKRFSGVDVVEVSGKIERYAVEHFARGVVDELEFDMLELFAYKFACAEVGDIACAEHRLLVARPEWVETLEQ